ncbi:hypothetical protein V6Z11_D10G079700 [Gossypium hirsutum]
MVMKAWMVVEKGRRIVRTAIFMVAMLASLIGSSLPLLVALGDIMVPFLLLSSFMCVTCYSFNQHFRLYAFKNSLIDIPLVSVLRSIIITCVYSMCDGPALSHGPYVGTVTLCAFVSIILLSIKACVFTVNSGIEAEASSSAYSLTSQRLHWKKSWGMPVLFLSSVVFALGHTVIAYRTSCRARRKLLFHRVDPEAVLSCKNVFSGFQKVPRSPTPSAGKTPKSDSETRRKPFGQPHDERELPARLLADIDSLFIALQGLTIHYKLSFPGSPPRSLSSTTFLEPKVTCTPQVATGKLKLDRLDDSVAQVETSHLNSGTLQQDIEVACSVAAFDRPGWGLTSRPSRKDWEGKELPNPYKLETQVDLLLSFCSEIGFSSVVLVGHDDGGLLALKAAQKVQTSMNSFNITIKAVVLLNVSLSREVVPAFARILLRTSLGKKHLVRPLLRTEITQVVNRRAWYDATKLTTEVLSLYKAPLCAEGWDEALHEISRLSSETILSPQNATSLLKAIEEMPVLVIAGAEDAHISLKSCQALASKLVNSRLVAISGCGHLPHEECPKALLAAISPFIHRLLHKPE